MRNPAESDKSAYGTDRHIRIAMTDKTLRRDCSAKFGARATPFVYDAPSITIKRSAGL